MQLRAHLPSLRTSSGSGADPGLATDEHGRSYDPRVFAVQRVGALVVAAVIAAERTMREAEIAVVNHLATPDQRRRVEAMARVHSRGERRDVWMSVG